RLYALAPPARGGRIAAVCGDRGSLALARGEEASGFPAVLLRARALEAIPDAERRSRGGVVVLRRGVPARQRAMDALGAARPHRGLAPQRPARAVQFHALSLDMGRLRLRVLFAVRLQADPVHLARH